MPMLRSMLCLLCLGLLSHDASAYSRYTRKSNVHKYIPKNYDQAPNYGKKLSNKYTYCPPPYRLSKSGMRWQGPNGWRSLSDSFVDRIAGFKAAQWNGVTIGKVVCVYKGIGEMTFPVTLQRSNLVQKPSTKNWSEAGERYNRFMQCLARNPASCGFIQKKTQAKDMQSIYADIASFK